MEFAGYRLWVTTQFMQVTEPIPTFVMEAAYHVTQLPLSSMHNAESVLELIRQEPRTVSDKILDVFTYKFVNQRMIMIKWTQAGVILSNDVTRAITGQESAIQKKVGLPSFTQLRERNAKLAEAAETDRKRKLQHTPVYTPARGEDYMTLQNQSGLRQADKPAAPSQTIQEIIGVQQTLITRMEELTEVSNLMVNAPPPQELVTRMDKQDEALSQLKAEQTRTNSMLAELLAKLKPAQLPDAGITTAFRTTVVKPGQTTPAALGGPQKGSSGRP
jgi:hypothetical protein